MITEERKAMFHINNYDEIWNKIDVKDRAVIDPFLNGAAPFKLVDIANNLGIKVLRSPLPPSISGMIKKAEDSVSGYEIILNKYDAKVRQRFTLAHEIGHYLLHRADIGDGIQDSALYRSKLGSFKETEANRFAASLLMPKKMLTQFIENHTTVPVSSLVSLVSERFDVSASAVEIRLNLDN